MNPNERIIKSILDDDLYKISMSAAAIRLYDDLDFQATFTNRGNTRFPDGFGDALREQVDMMADLSLTEDEERWLRTNPSLSWLPRSYIDFLKGYRFDPSEVFIQQHGSGLEVAISGPWYRAIRWEVPLLATISELYYRMTYQEPNFELLVKNFKEKTVAFQKAGCKVTDFGTRRRASYDSQYRITAYMKDYPDVYVGTSNMHFAYMQGLRPIGTHAHEWFMAHEAMFGPRGANRRALEAWMQVYKGRLGTALTDTYTTDVFLRDFDHLMARQFDGVRQDSGDPIEWGWKIIRHYKSLGIDPMSKTVIFSDALDTLRTVLLQETFAGRIGIAFGIGTFMTNDCGLKPLNIVIKAHSFTRDGQTIPVVKLSDTPGKHHGSKRQVELVKGILGVEEND